MNKEDKGRKYPDFTIYAEGKEFPVHRHILDENSEYFSLLLKADFAERTDGSSEERDVTADAVACVLNICYGEEPELNATNVRDAIKVCHRWRIPKAIKRCEDFLKRVLVVENCIELLEIARLYDLKDLESACTDIVANNLMKLTDEKCNTLLNETDVIAGLANSDESPNELWKWCHKWREIRQVKGEEVKWCKVMEAFPVEKFTIGNFNELVWQSSHLQRCSICKKKVGGNFLTGIMNERVKIFKQIKKNEREKRATEHIDDVVFVKHLAKDVNENIKNMADEFLTKNFGKFSSHPAFVDLSHEDLIKYLRGISIRCNRDMFSALMGWMRKEPSREDIFPKLFASEMKRNSPFLTDLYELRRTSDSAPDWHSGWLVDGNVFYVRRLALKYGCKEVQITCDKYIRMNFLEVSNTVEFAELPQEDVKRYFQMSFATMSSFREKWKCVVNWMEKREMDGNGDITCLVEIVKLIPPEDIPDPLLNDDVIPFLQNAGCKDYAIEILRYRTKSLNQEVAGMRRLDLSRAATAPECQRRTDIVD